MSCEVGTFIIPTLQMRKLKHKEVIRLAYCHLAGQWQNQNVSPHSFRLQSLLFTRLLYYQLERSYSYSKLMCT